MALESVFTSRYTTCCGMCRDGTAPRSLLLTGPNMGGKVTRFPGIGIDEDMLQRHHSRPRPVLSNYQDLKVHKQGSPGVARQHCVHDGRSTAKVHSITQVQPFMSTQVCLRSALQPLNLTPLLMPGCRAHSFEQYVHQWCLRSWGVLCRLPRLA